MTRLIDQVVAELNPPPFGAVPKRCPKCDNPTFVFCTRQYDKDTETVSHTCFCGWRLVTRPADAP